MRPAYPRIAYAFFLWLAFLATVIVVVGLAITSVPAPQVDNVVTSRVSQPRDCSTSSAPVSASPSFQRFRIALISDEFTYAHLLPTTEEVDYIILLADMYATQLELFEPDVLFVESLWKGRDFSWQGVISSTKPTHKLVLDVINWFKIRQKKVVFWSKEDPPNYEKFLFIAKECDYVFTTSIESLSRYESDLPPTARAELFALAIQPDIHNPFSTKSNKIGKKEDSCFAGSWMAFKYPVRGEHLGMLFDAALKVGTLSILDRTSGYVNKNYRYPDKYEPYLRQALPYNETLLYFRTCKAVLNVNSVQDSVTMLSRRVLELPAMGINLVTAKSHAIDFFLPEGAIPVVLSEGEAERILSKLVRSPSSGAQKSIGITRRTLAIDHSYTSRFNRIAEVIGTRPFFKELHIVGYSYLESCDEFDLNSNGRSNQMNSQLERLLRSYLRQQYLFKTLVVFVPSTEELQRCLARVGLKDIIFAVASQELLSLHLGAQEDIPSFVEDGVAKEAVLEYLAVAQKALKDVVLFSHLYRYYASYIDPFTFYGKLYFRDVASSVLSQHPLMVFKHRRYALNSGGDFTVRGKFELQCGDVSNTPPLFSASTSFALDNSGFKCVACASDPFDVVESFYRYTPKDGYSTVLENALVNKNMELRVLVLFDLPTNYHGYHKRKLYVRSMFKMLRKFENYQVDFFLMSSFADLTYEAVPSPKTKCEGAQFILTLLKKNAYLKNIRLLDPYGILHCNASDSDSFSLFSSAILMKRLLGYESVRSSVKRGIRMSPVAMEHIGLEVSRSFEYHTAMVPESLYLLSSLSSVSSSQGSLGTSFLTRTGSHVKLIVYSDTFRRGQREGAPIVSPPCNSRRSSAVFSDDFDEKRPYTRRAVFSVLDHMLTSPCSRSVVFVGENLEVPTSVSRIRKTGGKNLCFWGHSEWYLENPLFIDDLSSAFSEKGGTKLLVRDLGSFSLLDDQYVPGSIESTKPTKDLLLNLFPPSGLPLLIEEKENREKAAAVKFKKDKIFFRYHPQEELENAFENCSAVAFSSVPAGAPMFDSQMLHMDDLLRSALVGGIPTAIFHTKEFLNKHSQRQVFLFEDSVELISWAQRGFTVPNVHTARDQIATLGQLKEFLEETI